MSVAPGTLPANRYDAREWAGAFGDLGTLIPFLLTYFAVLGLDPGGVLLSFGAALLAVGLFYRTPFPVQPMKAIGAAAATQAVPLGLTAGSIHAATLLTGLTWLALGVTGLAARFARWLPRPVAAGIVLGLAFAFMLEGVQRMLTTWWLGAAALLTWFAFRRSRRVPVMFVLLALGVGASLVLNPSLGAALHDLRPALRMPVLALGEVTASDFLRAAVFLVLPQLPLTVGNALIAITEENNRLFPDRAVSASTVSYSTGLMNLAAAPLGGVPMCHGAGGMAGHVAFGARTGGASVILGVVLLSLGLCFAESIATLLGLLSDSVLGTILFIAGMQLSQGPLLAMRERSWQPALLATAVVGAWHIGWGFLAGIAAHYLARRLQRKI